MPTEGEIDLALKPRSPDRGWWMKADPAGQPALTRWRVLGRAADRTLLELRPVTGRTHQLRVHCAASGWPILGDPIYGSAPRFGGPGLHLHARARDGAALSEEAADRRRGAGAGAYERERGGVRRPRTRVLAQVRSG